MLSSLVCPPYNYITDVVVRVADVAKATDNAYQGLLLTMHTSFDYDKVHTLVEEGTLTVDTIEENILNCLTLSEDFGYTMLSVWGHASDSMSDRIRNAHAEGGCVNFLVLHNAQEAMREEAMRLLKEHLDTHKETVLVLILDRIESMCVKRARNAYLHAKRQDPIMMEASPSLR